MRLILTDPAVSIRNMKIKLASVMVNDQAHALKFYTEVLGFKKKMDVPAGDHRWITVVAEGAEDIELLLEPNTYAAAKAYQRAIFQDKIPFTSFFVDDVQDLLGAHPPNGRGRLAAAEHQRVRIDGRGGDQELEKFVEPRAVEEVVDAVEDKQRGPKL